MKKKHTVSIRILRYRSKDAHTIKSLKASLSGQIRETNAVKSALLDRDLEIEQLKKQLLIRDEEMKVKAESALLMQLELEHNKLIHKVASILVRLKMLEKGSRGRKQ